MSLRGLESGQSDGRSGEKGRRNSWRWGFEAPSEARTTMPVREAEQCSIVFQPVPPHQLQRHWRRAAVVRNRPEAYATLRVAKKSCRSGGMGASKEKEVP